MVDELQSGDSISDYQATVMTAIKCIVSTPQDVRTRVKLRNQFFGELCTYRLRPLVWQMLMDTFQLGI